MTLDFGKTPYVYICAFQDAQKNGATPSNSSPAAPSSAAPSTIGGDLPPGWFEAVDTSYNHPYWYNPSTGERSWQRPQVRPSQLLLLSS